MPHEHPPPSAALTVSGRGAERARTSTKDTATCVLDAVTRAPYVGAATHIRSSDVMTADFVHDTSVVRSFVSDVRTAIAAAPSPEAACEAITPRFAELLEDSDWLPLDYRLPAPQSGMGGGIGQWLLYRFNPERAASGENPLQLDSAAPHMPVSDYFQLENRFKMLNHSHPAAAMRLNERAQEDADARRRLFEFLAARNPGPPKPSL